MNEETQEVPVNIVIVSCADNPDKSYDDLAKAVSDFAIRHKRELGEDHTDTSYLSTLTTSLEKYGDDAILIVVHEGFDTSKIVKDMKDEYPGDFSYKETYGTIPMRVRLKTVAEQLMNKDENSKVIILQPAQESDLTQKDLLGVATLYIVDHTQNEKLPDEKGLYIPKGWAFAPDPNTQDVYCVLPQDTPLERVIAGIEGQIPGKTLYTVTDVRSVLTMPPDEIKAQNGFVSPVDDPNELGIPDGSRFNPDDLDGNASYIYIVNKNYEASVLGAAEKHKSYSMAFLLSAIRPDPGVNSRDEFGQIVMAFAKEYGCDVKCLGKDDAVITGDEELSRLFDEAHGPEITNVCAGKAVLQAEYKARYPKGAAAQELGQPD